FPILSSGSGAVQQENSIVQYPNPASDISYVSFKLHEESEVNIDLFDVQGKKVFSVMNNETKGYGKYIVPINLSEINLAAGSYFCKLTVNGKSKTLKMIV